MDLTKAIAIAGSGMQAQSARLTVVAENLANQETTGATPGADPYRRKTISFADVLDPATGVDLVKVSEVGEDQSPFPLRYDPGNPAANAAGYVKVPNVNTFIEMEDMRDAEQSYSADLQVLSVSRSMLSRVIGLLK
ncbi:MAG TPA: flagellar basal body rod protein FlgC [Acetobacteraceae bacterium]|nr:flagellar basal body rod protein FlgC [Acetobacteraceae bacterium]